MSLYPDFIRLSMVVWPALGKGSKHYRIMKSLPWRAKLAADKVSGSKRSLYSLVVRYATSAGPSRLQGCRYSRICCRILLFYIILVYPS